MATTVGLNFRLTAAVENFEKSMGEVNKKLGQIDRSSKQTASGMKLLAGIEVGRILLGGLKSIFGLMKSGVSTVFSLSKELASAADAIGKLSASTGVAVEPLQVFQKLAQDNGISGDKLGEALKRMTKRVAEAKQGFGEALPALNRLGLNVDQIAGMKPEQAFLKIGAAIGQLPSKGAQAAAAFKIFSDQGLAMVPMFADMKSQVQATSEELLQLGGILSGTQIKNIEEMNTRWGTVYDTVRKIGTQVLGNLAPIVTAMAEDALALVKAFEYNGNTGGQALANYMTDAFFTGAESLAGVFDSFGDILTNALLTLEDWLTGFSKYVSLLTDTKWDGSPMDFENFHSDIANNLQKQARALDSQLSDLEVLSAITGGFIDDQKKQGELVRKRNELMGQARQAEADYVKERRLSITGERSAIDIVRSAKDRYTKAIDEAAANTRALSVEVKDVSQGSTVLADIFKTGSRGVASAMDILRDGPRSAVQSVVGSMTGLLNSVGLTRDKMAQLAQTTKFLNDVEKTELDKRMSQWDQWAAQQKDILKGLGGNTFAIESHFADMRKVYEAQEKQRLAEERTQFNAELDRRAAIQQRIDDRMERIRTGNYKKSTDKFDTGFSAVFKTVGDFWEGLTGGDGVIDFPELEETLPELKNQTTEIQNVAKAVTNMAANFVLASF